MDERAPSLIGFKPEPEHGWTVRRCPLHELVPPDDDHCPVVFEFASCGLMLSEPFVVQRP